MSKKPQSIDFKARLRGRERSPAAERRTETVNVLLTPAERERLNELVLAADLTVTEFCRRRIFAETDR